MTIARRFVGTVAAASLACNQLFGLTPPEDDSPPTVSDADDPSDPSDDAALGDGAPGDAGRDGACMSQAASLVADTYISASTPGGSYGQQTVLNVGLPLTTSGLVRFAVPLGMTGIAPSSATLTFHYAASARECSRNSDCDSCAGLDDGGAFALSFLTSDWDEGSATWNYRRGMMSWSSPGASGADRSEIIAQVDRGSDRDLVFELDAMALSEWLSWGPGETIGFVASAADGALIAAGRESNDCIDVMPTTLALTYCR